MIRTSTRRMVLAGYFVLAAGAAGFEQSGQAAQPTQAVRVEQVDGRARYTNRLIDEKSPYLQLHAHNPVDWFAWGAEAFEKARREGKPIFLSIGYSTCHWCHVMEAESFSDPSIAEIMNGPFVSMNSPIEAGRPQTAEGDFYVWTADQIQTVLGGEG